MITPGWLPAYGTGILEGRDFDDRDTAGVPSVMLVNESFVRRFLEGQNPLGTTLTLTFRSNLGDVPLGPSTIVGVVGDAVYRSIREPLRPTIYQPLAQRTDPLLYTNFFIAVRSSSGSPALLTRQLAEALSASTRLSRWRFSQSPIR